jgi:DNA-binding NarL/FixJ family response regulator
MTRVVLGDDHLPSRAGTVGVLRAAGMELCADVGSAETAVAAALRHRPDACLLEVTLPGGGIAAAEEIALRAPEVAVIMLTVATDDASLFAALRAGARGYLVKDTDPDRLPAAIRGVIAGEAAIPRGMVARVLEEFCSRELRRRRTAPGEGLSAREWDVMELLAAGLPTRVIATRLAISEVTVRRHAAAATRKLRAPSRQAAVQRLRPERQPVPGADESSPRANLRRAA